MISVGTGGSLPLKVTRNVGVVHFGTKEESRLKSMGPGLFLLHGMFGADSLELKLDPEIGETREKTHWAERAASVTL